MTDRLNLIESISKVDKLSTFSRLLGTSGANAAFSEPGQFTVFAPTNDAFGKIPDARMNELLNEPNQVQLKALLSYHIMPGRVMAATLGERSNEIQLLKNYLHSQMPAASRLTVREFWGATWRRQTVWYTKQIPFSRLRLRQPWPRSGQTLLP